MAIFASRQNEMVGGVIYELLINTNVRMVSQLKRQDLIYPELSYSIIGCAYEVHNELGAGHPEKVYQKAMAKIFEIRKINYKEQIYFPLKFHNTIISKSFFDFLVDEKVIVELKKDTRFSKSHIEQVNEYLKISDLKLAILINFSKDGVIFRRLVNINRSNS